MVIYEWSGFPSVDSIQRGSTNVKRSHEELSEEFHEKVQTFAKIPKQGPLEGLVRFRHPLRNERGTFNLINAAPLPIIRRSTSTNSFGCGRLETKLRSYEYSWSLTTSLPTVGLCTKRRVQSIPHSENVFYRKHESRR